MLKKAITYTDFNGDSVTETFYFNLSESELLELELEFDGGLYGLIEQISKTEDFRQIVQIFKRLVLDSYGVKSTDGKRFVKSAEERTGFSQTAAFDALFMQLATDDKEGELFIKGMLPSSLMAAVAKQEAENAEKAKQTELPPTYDASTQA